MDEKDIEVLPDGRIALILHDGKLERGMSTHEVKKAFLSGVGEVPAASFFQVIVMQFAQYTKRLELK